MTGGLVRQALRRHPWSFAGPAVTQFLAGAIIAGALGGNASMRDAVLTPATRQALQDSGVLDIPVVFVLISVYLTVLIVGITMTTAIARQARDIALVRAIGATPAWVRRAIAVQAALVAAPATLLGLPFGAVLGRLWIDGLVSHGVLPVAVRFHTSAAAVPVARIFGGVGALAADNLVVRAKALSGALVPLVLAVAFAATKVVMHATSVAVDL